MELKDMVLSTLAEFDNGELKQKLPIEDDYTEPKNLKVKNYIGKENQEAKELEAKEDSKLEKDEVPTDEKIFLNNIHERILVLFEGLQNPQNENLDKKLDITLNFLEYLLASIEKRLDQLQ